MDDSNKRPNNSGTIGNKGGGRTLASRVSVMENYEKHNPLFWKVLAKLMLKEDKWALSEYNKIQLKLMPNENINHNDETLVISIGEKEKKIIESLVTAFKTKLREDE